MSRQTTNKLYTNFSKGLITEASPLAFPEGATLDELNCDLDVRGDRVRRWGHNTHGTFEPISILGLSDDPDIFTHVWRSVDEIDNLNYLVIQIESTVHFYQMGEASTYTKKGFTLDLQTYRLASASVADLRTSYCAFASGKGSLFIVNRFTEPMRVEVNSDQTALIVTPITIKVRDFQGLDDSLAVDEEPTTLSAAHNYNLRNQGWINPAMNNTGTAISSVGLFGGFTSINYPTTTGPIAEYFSTHSRYPGNNKVWWTGKNAEGVFDPALLEKIFFGNTRTARGHFILNAFNKDRSSVSGVAGLTPIVDTTRPEAVEFTSGRTFFGHKSTVYFSPVLTEVARIGECYQEADPTAEDISDLIATDGGVIEIPNADKIIALKAIANGLAVFATNGVWFIASGAQGFTAQDYALTQVSSVGTESPRSVTLADNMVFWWSRVGIQAMQQSSGQFGPISGAFDKVNITEDTIQTFYNEISITSRNNVKAQFDPATNKVFFMYKGGSNRDVRFLIYDITLKAFTPWSVSHSGSYPIGMFVNTYFVTDTAEPAFIEFLSRGQRRSIIDDTVTYINEISLSNFVDREYRDYYSYSEDFFETSWPAEAYESYLETGYEVLEDGLRIKQIPFVGVYFRRTEEVLELEGEDAVYVYPSSCKMQVKWDWTVTSRPSKWSTEVQVYRPKTSPFFSSLVGASTDYDVVYSRNKVRGSGRAIQFRFSEGRIGYGFSLLGWHTFFEGKTDV